MAVTQEARARPGSAAPTRPPRIAGLDGLRALAVVAVIGYHLDDRWMPGGFLGVDVFFVLSGYLITTLVVGEWRRAGWIDLPAFWRRRARRLLPSLLLAVAVVASLTPLLFAEVADRIRGEAVAALFQVPNWFEAMAGRSYFESLGRPSPLRHLWSLGVEAQFYVLWPLVAAVALRRGGRRWLARVALAGAGASFLAMALAFRTGHDPSWIYYGTGFRLGTLLVGAVLAVWWPAERLQPVVGRRAVAIVDGAALACLAGLAVLAFTLGGTSSGAYRGGLLLVAALAAVLVAATVHPAARTGRVLAWPPLVWLGTRSYAVYLWHWPVILATGPGAEVVVHGWALLGVRLAVTAALAEASTRLVAGALSSARRAGPISGRRLVLATAGVLAVAMATTAATPTSTRAVFFVSPTSTVAPASTVVVSATSSTSTTPARPATTAAPSAAPAAPATTAPPTTVAPVPLAVRAVAVGESVLLGAGGEVQRALGPATVIDADIARQPDDVLDAVQARRAAGQLDGIADLVVQLGTNGELKTRHLERLAVLAEGVPRVVAVTVFVPRPWQDASNQALQAGAARYPWLRLADWHAAAAQHPEWFGPDGIHVNAEGARRYAALVADAAAMP